MVVIFLTTEQQKSFITKAVFYTVLVILSIIVIKLITGPLLPFTLAATLTVMLQSIINPLVSKFKLKRKPASVALVVILFSVMTVISALLFRAIYRQLADFFTQLPEYTEKFSGIFERISKSISSFFGELPFSGNALNDVPATAMKTVAENLAEGFTSVATRFAAGIPTFLLALVVTVIACIYFAKDYIEIKEFLFNRLSDTTVKKLQFIKATIVEKLFKLFKGYLIIIAITFVELFLGLTLIGYNYALILAAIISLVDILPVLGSGTVLIPWAIAAALSGHTSNAIVLVILYAVITAVRNIFEPKIIGDKLGVHPILMLASVFVGARIFGLGGIIVAPLTLVIIQSVISPDNTLRKNQK